MLPAVPSLQVREPVTDKRKPDASASPPKKLKLVTEERSHTLPRNAGGLTARPATAKKVFEPGYWPLCNQAAEQISRTAKRFG